MAKGRIFFKDKVSEYMTHGGRVRVSPIPVQLENGEKGYFLGDDWDAEIIGKGATTRSVIRDEIMNYPLWSDYQNSHSFNVGDKVAIDAQTNDDWNLVFYECIQAHSKQSDWSPDSTPALWSEITFSGDIEVWTPPIGGDGRYPYLDPSTGKPYRVSHNGFVWENAHTGGLNVWEPGVFGWTNIGPA